MKRHIPILLTAITGASLMAGPAAAQEVQRQCKRDLPAAGEYDLYQCAVEEYGIVPPQRGGDVQQ